MLGLLYDRSYLNLIANLVIYFFYLSLLFFLFLIDLRLNFFCDLERISHYVVHLFVEHLSVQLLFLLMMDSTGLIDLLPEQFN